MRSASDANLRPPPTTPTPAMATPLEATQDKFELTVTDMRMSTWAAVPRDERRQKNFKISGEDIRHSFAALEVKIVAALRDRNQSTNPSADFIVCNPDEVLVDQSNCAILKNGDSLMLLDPNQKVLPFIFQYTFSTAPHSKAVTSQKGAYHGTPRHNVSAFALADLVDNSLSATAGIQKRRIEIRFYDNGDNSAIHVLDNGRGMTSEALQQALIYKAPKSTRRFTPETHFTCLDTPSRLPSEDFDEEAHPLYLNSNISMFGAGMKKAVFFLGARVIIMTKTTLSTNVLENMYSAELLEKNERAHRDDAWKSSTAVGPAGTPRHSNLPDPVRALIEKEEPGKRQFTHLVIDKLDPDILELLRRKDLAGEECPSIEKQLAHIYHYYIHGRRGNIVQAHARDVDIIVTRVDSRGNCPMRMNLADLPNERLDLESQYVRTAADTYLFTVEFTKFNESNENHYKVGGIIRYHPYLYSRETIPSGAPTRKRVEDRTSSIDAGTEGDEGGSSPEQGNESEQEATTPSTSRSRNVTNIPDKGPPRKCGEFFTIWWNGRLVPLTPLESFDWCSPGSLASSKTAQLYDRISGSLFFDSTVEEITDNKLNISATTKLLEMFNEKKIHTQQSTFQRVTEVNGRLVAKGKPMKKEFTKWLKDCQRHDKQVIYSGRMLGEGKIKPDQNSNVFYPYKKAVWNNVTLKAGDMVKFLDPSSNAGRYQPLIGRIAYFLVPAKNVEGDRLSYSEDYELYAPLGLAAVDPLPAGCYTEKITRNMAEIDTKLKTPDVKLLLKNVENELAMKMLVKSFDANFQLNNDMTKFVDPIPIDSVLLKTIHFVIAKADGSEVKGVLPHHVKSKGKKISIVARVHKILEDGRRELFFTSDICQYWTAPSHKKKKSDQAQEEGYYFLASSMDLEHMQIRQPGKYIITFRAFVDLHENRQRASGAQREQEPLRTPSGRGRQPLPASGEQVQDEEEAMLELEARAEDPYEVEWGKPIDKIGRKILTCEDKRIIRLPHHDIEFTVIAGGPTSARIDQIGDEDQILRIGDPFPIYLSFWDGKGNQTEPPSDLDGLYPKGKPLVSLAARKNSDINLQFSRGPFETAEDLVRIKNVVATGQLDGSQFKNIKLEVTLNKFRRLTSDNQRMHVGLPFKLRPLQPAVELENGERAKIMCHILDCSGNVITIFFGSDQKPILLTCDFYREGVRDESQKLFTCDVLALLELTQTNAPPPETSEFIELGKFQGSIKAPVTLDCVLSHPQCTEKATIKITIKPSRQPEFLKLYEIVNDLEIEIPPRSNTNRQLGESIPVNLKLFDGLNNEIEFDPAKHAFRFDDWPRKSKTNNQSKLVLRIPTKAELGRKVRTFLDVQLQANKRKSIEHMFYVNTKPGGLTDQAKLEVEMWNANEGNEEEMEEIAERFRAIPGRIQIPIDKAEVKAAVKIIDRHGNVIKDGVDMDYISSIQLGVDGFSIECEPVLAEDVEDEEFSGSFMVKFRPPNTPGNKDICFKLGDLASTLKVQMLPGKPTGLAFEIDGKRYKQHHSGAIPVQNMKPTQIRVVLIDAKQNPTAPTESMGVSLELGGRSPWPEQSRLINSVVLRPNPGGGSEAADFGRVTIGVQNQTPATPCADKASRCGKPLCFQVQNMTARIQDKPGFKAFIKFHVAARTDVPQAISPETDGKPFCYVAGSSFDNLKVCVLAEDMSQMTSGIQQHHLVMQIAPKHSEGGTSVDTLEPTKLKNGFYTFGNVPQRAGIYSTKFVLVYQGCMKLECAFDDLVILSGDVTSIQPSQEWPQDPVFVSGVADSVTDRTIVENLKLVLRDQFGNNVNATTRSDPRNPLRLNDDMQGEVKVELVEPEHCPGLLRLEDHSNIIGCSFLIDDGEVRWGSTSSFVVEKNRNLVHNSQYILRFTARLAEASKRFAYEMKFNVLNNILQHKEIKNLEVQEVTLKNKLDGLRRTIAKITQEKNDLSRNFNTADAQEKAARRELISPSDSENSSANWQLKVDALQTVPQIEKAENSLIVKHTKIKNRRKECGTAQTNILPDWDSVPQVLGQVGRLVEIKSEGNGLDADRDIQRVLSWHMQGNLRTVVVLDEARGLALSKIHTDGNFMLLDILQNAPRFHQNWNASVPEELLQYGHPVYARTLLSVPENLSEQTPLIRKAIGILLGDTIMVDSLADATRFMKEYNRLSSNGGNNRIRGWCPEIITRDGMRLSSKGIIGGGARNQAPRDISHLSYFGLGPNSNMQRLDQELLRLGSLKQALETKLKAKQQVEEYVARNRNSLHQLKNNENSILEEIKQIQVELAQKKRDQAHIFPTTPTSRPQALQSGSTHATAALAASTPPIDEIQHYELENQPIQTRSRTHRPLDEPAAGQGHPTPPKRSRN